MVDWKNNPITEPSPDFPVMGISIDYITFIPSSNPNKTCYGFNVVFGAGGEFEIHESENYTESSKSWNPFSCIGGIRYD